MTDKRSRVFTRVSEEEAKVEQTQNAVIIITLHLSQTVDPTFIW